MTHATHVSYSPHYEYPGATVTQGSSPAVTATQAPQPTAIPEQSLNGEIPFGLEMPIKTPITPPDTLPISSTIEIPPDTMPITNEE